MFIEVMAKLKCKICAISVIVIFFCISSNIYIYLSLSKHFQTFKSTSLIGHWNPWMHGVLKIKLTVYTCNDLGPDQSSNTWL